MKKRKLAWLMLAALLSLTSLSLTGCAGSNAGGAGSLPPFPVFPELSPAFYEQAPKPDLDKLLQREWSLTAWKRMVEDRVK